MKLLLSLRDAVRSVLGTPSPSPPPPITQLFEVQCIQITRPVDKQKEPPARRTLSSSLHTCES